MSPENNHLFLAPPEDLHRASSAYPDHALTTDDEDDASLSGSDEEYTDEDDDGSHLSLINSHSREEDVALVGSFRRTSFVYGQRSAFVPSSPLSTALSALTANERETMLVQERELLNDNKYVSNSKSYGTSELYGPRPGSSASSIAPLGPPAFPVSERTGLLSATAPEWEEAVEAGAINTTYLRELKVLAKSAPLLYITFALQYSLTVASIFSAGRLGKSELAGVSLGSMTATITGYAVYQGLTTALDTLCSQSYGAGNKKLVGLHLQRMVCFLMAITVPISIVWIFSESILNLVVPEPELAEFAGLYLRILILGLPGYALFEAGKRYVQAQGLFKAATYVLLICAPVNALMNWVLVWHPTIGVGFKGAPIAVCITDWLMAILLFLYVRFIAGKECWGGFSKRAFVNWGPMIKLAIPGFIMLEAEWLAFEILTLMASHWGTAHVAAQSVLSTTSSMTFQLPFALSVAVSTRVANLLGATLGNSAKTAAQLGMMVAMGVGIINFLLVMSLRYQVVRWFSNDPEVIALYVKTVPLGAVFQLFDAIGVATAGLLRGQGRQHLGSYINLVAYYVVAMPISIFCGFFLEWELLGLWSGVAVALLAIAVIEVVIIMRTDWEAVVDDAKNRVEAS